MVVRVPRKEGHRPRGRARPGSGGGGPAIPPVRGGGAAPGSARHRRLEPRPRASPGRRRSRDQEGTRGHAELGGELYLSLGKGGDVGCQRRKECLAECERGVRRRRGVGREEGDPTDNRTIGPIERLWACGPAPGRLALRSTLRPRPRPERGRSDAFLG